MRRRCNALDVLPRFAPNTSFLAPCPPRHSVTLTPSNQIIHPARYYSIFRDALERKAAANGGDDWGYTREELEASKSLELYKDFDPLSAEVRGA